MMNRTKRANQEDSEFNDKLVYINRVSKVVKGGKRLSFSALMVSGDGHGSVGVGIGKANEVPAAINKSSTVARKNMIKIVMKDNTIPHGITVKFGAAKVMLKPASAGTGIIAGGAVRAVVETCGIKDILTKSMGSANKTNVAKATLLGLSKLRDPKEVVAKRKNTAVKDTEASGG
jgi:small subunit ribosomal protein S5